jgi:ABC-type Fe3+ transport system substrate-binding protein
MRKLNLLSVKRGFVLAVGLSMSFGQSALALDTAEILNYVGADREQVLVEGAKKEGELVVYSAMIVDQALRPLTDAFMAKYPFETVTFWRGDSESLAQRVLAESRANNVVADVVEGTSVAAALTEADVVQKFTSPALDQYPAKLRDANNLWAATRLSYYCMAYNTDLVTAAEVPKTFDDLLDPKWKGKIAWRIGSESGTPLFLTNLRTTLGDAKADEYFQKLGKQEIINFGAGSARTLVDRVVAGEYPLAVNIFCHHPLISKSKGAPVGSQLMEPVATTAATMSIPKGVLHPYGAALFTDFLLSEEGQTILAGASYFPANPNVLPKKLLSSIVPSQGSHRRREVH